MRLGNPLRKARAAVEDAIRDLGAPLDKARAGDDAWTLRKGSAQVHVRLVGSEPELAYLQVASHVLDAPPGRPALETRLLRLNHEMGGLAAYAITPDRRVVLASARPVRGLSADEVAAVIAHVAHFSDLHDDELRHEFG